MTLRGCGWSVFKFLLWKELCKCKLKLLLTFSWVVYRPVSLLHPGDSSQDQGSLLQGNKRQSKAVFRWICHPNEKEMGKEEIVSILIEWVRGWGNQNCSQTRS